MSESLSKSNKLENFDQEALDAFVKDLNQYDKDHSQGSWLGRQMVAIMFSSMGEEEKGEGDGLSHLHQEIQQNLTLPQLEARHNKALDTLGLNLESPNKNGNFNENEIYTIGDIKINLKDNKKYLSFLKSLEPEKLSATQRKILEMVVTKINNQIQNWYSVEYVDERLLDAFAGMPAMIVEYERLGMSEEVARFKDYLEAMKGGYLSEYIVAKNRNIFKPIGEGFNLSTYQCDSTYEGYVSRWSREVFETLEEVKKNPKAKEFFNKILQYAKACIAFAENDPRLKEYEEKDKKSGSKYTENIKRGITEVKERLSQISQL